MLHDVGHALRICRWGLKTNGKGLVGVIFFGKNDLGAGLYMLIMESLNAYSRENFTFN